MTEQLIPVKVSMKRLTGTVLLFAAFVNHTKLFSGGEPEQEGTVQVPDGPVTVKVRAWGVGAPTYALKVDLPGTVRDAELTFTLKGGYHEISMEL